MAEVRAAAAARTVPVLGVTGPGGSGKSTLTDELVLRFRLDQEDKLRIAVLAVDPDAPTHRWRAPRRPHPHERHRRRPQVVVRSVASRSATTELPACMPTC